MSKNSPDLTALRNDLLAIQQAIIDGLQQRDPSLSVQRDEWVRPEGGGGRSIAVKGDVFEKAGVNFSDVFGHSLPPSATRLRPQLQGRSFRAMGISVVIHPQNPYVPTTHMNVRIFSTTEEQGERVWWFGGGFDLTPFYPFPEDAREWHQAARNLCLPFGGDSWYQKLKQHCDDYFYLPHRDETRGVGGLFFDDLNEPDFDSCRAFALSVGNSFFSIYDVLVARRMHTPYTKREREFQLYRRGRYVEFNLLYDRGTLFGIQSRGRTESILMSLPPLVRWEYGYIPEPASEEANLDAYLKPRNWLE